MTNWEISLLVGAVIVIAILAKIAGSLANIVGRQARHLDYLDALEDRLQRIEELLVSIEIHTDDTARNTLPPTDLD